MFNETKLFVFMELKLKYSELGYIDPYPYNILKEVII